jgi:hypothetical protein
MGHLDQYVRTYGVPVCAARHGRARGPAPLAPQLGRPSRPRWLGVLPLAAVVGRVPSRAPCVCVCARAHTHARTHQHTQVPCGLACPKSVNKRRRQSRGGPPRMKTTAKRAAKPTTRVRPHRCRRPRAPPTHRRPSSLAPCKARPAKNCPALFKARRWPMPSPALDA